MTSSHREHARVGQLTARARPDLAQPAGVTGRARRVRSAAAPAGPYRPRRRRPRFLDVTVGWATWFGNRKVGLRDRWFQLRTTWHYRGCPQP